MKTIELTFPATVEDFLAYQETLIGGELIGDNREAVAVWVPVFNGCYEDGRQRDYVEMKRRLDLMDRFMEEQKDNPLVYKMLKTSKTWMAIAWDQGRRDAEEASV